MIRGAIATLIMTSLLAGTTGIAASADHPLNGANLYADVVHYAGLGVHRFGTRTDHDTIDWIAAEMTKAGLKTEFQEFTLGKQYFLDQARVSIGSSAMEALPFWWPPEDKASFALTAPLAASDSGDASGHIVWLKLPYDRAAYLADTHRQAIKAAAARSPAAIVVTIDNPGDDIYVYNVAQDDAPWPVPVVIVASKDKALLQTAQHDGTPVSIDVKGRYATNVAGRNVIGRIDRGAAKTIVVSTPTTGWFTCACERGSGIAGFLAMARQFAVSKADVNFVFVATAGHEVGHGGMEVFLHRQPPPPDKTLAWIHFGASIACYQWEKTEAGWTTAKQVDPQRAMISSPSAAALTESAFAGQPFVHVVAKGPPPGELREIYGAGYTNYFGIAAPHRFFHNPVDTPTTTGPEALEPVVGGFAKAIETIADKGDAAFTDATATPSSRPGTH